MNVDLHKGAFVGIVAFGLASCAGTPSATVPMSGQWKWLNAHTSYTLEQDKVTCSGEANAILSRLNQCHSAPPTDCESLSDSAAKAMCQYSNSTTKNMCSAGRINIPKTEIVDGCIAARGWKQVWVKTES